MFGLSSLTHADTAKAREVSMSADEVDENELVVLT
jgi:hypothetical protein